MMRRKVGKLLGDRRVVGGFLLLIQLAIVMFGVSWASTEYHWLTPALTVLSVIIVIWLVRKYDNPMYKITWMLVIVLLPLFGGLFYLFWGNTPLNRARTQHQYEPKPPDFTDYMRTPATKELIEQHPRHAARARYIETLDGMPVWTNTETKYFRIGEEMFDSMCKASCAAHRSSSFWSISSSKKASCGILSLTSCGRRRPPDWMCVCCTTTLVRSARCRKNYDRYLMSLGIHAVRFNRFIPTLNTYLNYRNHRKMTIIDGNVGYMGGINLADEYINKKVRFGYWKDTGIMLRGEGTANMTALFLQMWEYVTGEDMPPLENYLPTAKLPADGYVQPFADSPLDDINIGESTYLQIIHNARKYVYITTPYLVLDNEMITALTIAAQSGVDVRILTPGIPDKKLVYMITRSYYQQLHRAGVKIYEYRPGFLHAKTIVSDDDTAVVGTINMDFRSFFLHFECATCFYNSSVVAAVKQDIMETINVSRRIDDEWLRRVPWIRSIMASVLRLFAPLL